MLKVMGKSPIPAASELDQGTESFMPEDAVDKSSERRKKGLRKDRRQQVRRRTMQVPAFFSLVLIASLSLALLLVVYSWQAAAESGRETQLFGEANSAILGRLSRAGLAELESDGGGPLLAQLRKHPNFLYLLVETRHGKRLADHSNRLANLIVPAMPLSSNQRQQHGYRDFSVNGGADDITEFYSPVSEVEDRVLRLGMFKPKFYWPSGGIYYLLLSLPLILLTFAALSALFTTYMPIKLLSNHFKSMKDSKELSGIDNSVQSSPLLENFNELVANTKTIISEIEMKQDSLQLNSKVLNFDKLRAEAVINALPDGVLALDRSGLTTFCNNRMLRFFPASASRTKETLYSEWCNVSEVVQYIGRHLKNPASSNMERLEFCYSEAPSNRKIAMVSARPLLNKSNSNEVLGSLYVFRDISSEVQNKKISEEFVINAAHELKTPLHVIKMYAETLMEDDVEPALLTESVNTIYDQVDRMASLVNNLLNIAKIEIGEISLERSRIKLQDFLKDIFDTMQRSAENTELVLEKSIPENLSVIVADKELLRVAINNLLSNAIKYSGERGQVTLIAEETDEQIIIRVEDKGPGISADDQQHIFDKFYRSEDEGIRQKSGHGLGLTLSRNIIQLHHGSLVVESELGEGSTFTITFNKKFNIIEKVSS